MTERAEFSSGKEWSLRYLYERAMDESDDNDGWISFYNLKAYELLAEVIEKDCTNEERIRVSKAKSAYIRKLKYGSLKQLDVTFDTVKALRHLAANIEKRIGKDYRLNHKQLIEYVVCELGENIANADDDKLKRLCVKMLEGHDFLINDEDEQNFYGVEVWAEVIWCCCLEED